MKNLNLNISNGIEKLNRDELKNVIGGDYATCYNICMSGYDREEHTVDELSDKVLACDGSCG